MTLVSCRGHSPLLLAKRLFAKTSFSSRHYYETKTIWNDCRVSIAFVSKLQPHCSPLNLIKNFPQRFLKPRWRWRRPPEFATRKKREYQSVWKKGAVIIRCKFAQRELRGEQFSASLALDSKADPCTGGKNLRKVFFALQNSLSLTRRQTGDRCTGTYRHFCIKLSHTS